MLRLDLDKQLVKLKIAHADIRFRHLASSLPTGPTLFVGNFCGPMFLIERPGALSLSGAGIEVACNLCRRKLLLYNFVMVKKSMLHGIDD